MLPVKAAAKSSPKKSKGSLTLQPPKMPAFRKHAPIHWGTCTIYSDAVKGQRRATEAANRRKDVKFRWSKDGWDRLLAWCRANGKDE